MLHDEVDLAPEAPVETQEQKWFTQYKDQSYPALARRMKELATLSAAAERQRKDLNAELDVIRLKVVPERFAEDELLSIRIEGIGTLGVAGDMHCTMLNDKKPELFEWLRNNDYGDLIKEGVNASSLKSLVKELGAEDALLAPQKAESATLASMLEEPGEDRGKTQREEIEAFLDIKPFSRASVTKR